MEMIRLACLVLLVAAAAAPCLAAPSPAKKARAADGLEPLVRRLDAKIGALIDPGALLEDKEFIRVFESPAPARAEAQSLLARADVSGNQKFITVYAMQRLPLKDYIQFVEKLLELKLAGKVTPSVYSNGAFPTYEWSTALAENYRDPAVIAFLKKARAAATNDDQKALIDETLSGQAAADVRELREDGQLGVKKAVPPKK